ncbi:class I SAM-dependent methyltransferase [Reichenbachiella carrageenanivorans]|uniref:Class I SAM-dependent methyltransferase n=1 Tax=Reichenbachiella carrageenanivorans TaxID=2979869 RepID=A0ABY6CXB5_9BACT|nr:class I SAM-dependent methyltransferase [Reichenbachiella carrageenanivorans]UXX78542.1 class I SAM-dependent methyltransferase [Reichenbachiella carrageenanivorans]
MTLQIIVFRIIRYIRYWLLCMDEHGLQSPFVFQVYKEVLNPSKRKKCKDTAIESLRSQLSKDDTVIMSSDFGSGSSMAVAKSKQVKTIAQSGISELKQSEVITNLIAFVNASHVLELGASLGINTLYMSKVSVVEQVISIEANPELAALASDHLKILASSNAEIKVVDVDDFFEANSQTFNLIYIDANHTYEATIRYFNQAVKVLSTHGALVIDDINWSPGMSKAWTQIIAQHPAHLYLENHKFGIVFANRALERNHYILRF